MPSPPKTKINVPVKTVEPGDVARLLSKYDFSDQNIEKVKTLAGKGGVAQKQDSGNILIKDSEGNPVCFAAVVKTYRRGTIFNYSESEGALWARMGSELKSIISESDSIIQGLPLFIQYSPEVGFFSNESRPAKEALRMWVTKDELASWGKLFKEVVQESSISDPSRAYYAFYATGAKANDSNA